MAQAHNPTPTMDDSEQKEKARPSGADAQKVLAEQYREEAEKGDAVARHNLAVCYQIGQGVPQDQKQAVQHFRRAAEQGYQPSQFQLAHYLEHGWGTGKDPEESAAWYRKAKATSPQSPAFSTALAAPSTVRQEGGSAFDPARSRRSPSPGRS